MLFDYKSDTTFEGKLLNFNCDYHYILVNIESKDYKGKAVIRNDYMFRYFTEIKKYKRKRSEYVYKRDMIKILMNNRSIKSNLNKEGLQKKGFRFVEYIKGVSDCSLDEKAFLFQKYFKDSYSLKDPPYNVQLAIVAKLFEWKILMFNESESGCLTICDNPKASLTRKERKLAARTSDY